MQWLAAIGFRNGDFTNFNRATHSTEWETNRCVGIVKSHDHPVNLLPFEKYLCDQTFFHRVASMPVSASDSCKALTTYPETVLPFCRERYRVPVFGGQSSADRLCQNPCLAADPLTRKLSRKRLRHRQSFPALCCTFRFPPPIGASAF